jgi:hypothetical protein
LTPHAAAAAAAYLFQVLVSPLADNPVRADLDFEVPSCYKHTPPRLQPGYLAKFKEETLFYIFYSMPQVNTFRQVQILYYLFFKAWRENTLLHLLLHATGERLLQARSYIV